MDNTLSTIKYNKKTHSFEKKDESFDGIFWIEDIEKNCASIVETYLSLQVQLKHAREENEKLKDNVWKEEEMSRLKAENERLKADYYRGFPISEEESKKIDAFVSQYRNRYYGAIGGGFTYKFIPTSIGFAGVIIGPDGKEFTFKEIH